VIACAERRFAVAVRDATASVAYPSCDIDGQLSDSADAVEERDRQHLVPCRLRTKLPHYLLRRPPDVFIAQPGEGSCSRDQERSVVLRVYLLVGPEVNRLD